MGGKMKHSFMVMATLCTFMQMGCGSRTPAPVPQSAAPAAIPRVEPAHSAAPPSAPQPPPSPESKPGVAQAIPAAPQVASPPSLPQRQLPPGQLLADLTKDFRASENGSADSTNSGRWTFMAAAGVNPWEGQTKPLEWSAAAGESPRFMFKDTTPDLLTSEVSLAATPDGGVVATPSYAAPHATVVRWTSGISGEVTVQGAFQWRRPTEGKELETHVFIDGVLLDEGLLVPGTGATRPFQVTAPVQPGSTVDLVVREAFTRAPRPKDLNDTTITAAIVKTGVAAGQLPMEIVSQISETWKNNPKRPLPKDAKFEASIDNSDNRVDWYRKIFVDSFRRECQFDAQSKQEIEAFLHSYCLSLAEIPVPPDATQLVNRGLAALPAGKWEPAASAALATLLFQRGGPGDLAQAMTRLDAAEKDFAKMHYPPELTAQFKLYLASLYLNRIKQDPEKTARDGRVRIEQSADDFSQAASRADLTNFDRQMLVRIVNKQFNPQTLPMCRYLVVARLRQEPKVDPWVRHVVLAREHFRLGWVARGNGFANTVSQEGQRHFRRQLNFAAFHAVSAWKLRPELPEPAALMIAISMAGSRAADEGTRFWFDEAVRADLFCAESYERYSWALRPRWGGSCEEMLSLAQECLDTERFDTRLPLQCLMISLNVKEELGSWDLVLKYPGAVDNLAREFKGYAAVAADENGRALQLSQLAAIYVLAGRNEEAKKLVNELGAQANRSVFEAYGAPFPMGN